MTQLKDVDIEVIENKITEHKKAINDIHYLIRIKGTFIKNRKGEIVNLRQNLNWRNEKLKEMEDLRSKLLKEKGE